MSLTLYGIKSCLIRQKPLNLHRKQKLSKSKTIHSDTMTTMSNSNELLVRSSKLSTVITLRSLSSITLLKSASWHGPSSNGSRKSQTFLNPRFTIEKRIESEKRKAHNGIICTSILQSTVQTSHSITCCKY